MWSSIAPLFEEVSFANGLEELNPRKIYEVYILGILLYSVCIEQLYNCTQGLRNIHHAILVLWKLA